MEKTGNLHGFKLAYKPRNINVVFNVTVDHNSRAVHLTRCDHEGFLRSAVYPMQRTRLMIIYCGMAVKMECVTLIGKGI